MTRTLTLTGTISRMDAIVKGIEYTLKQVAKLETRLIPCYLDAVRSKFIEQFTFYGLKSVGDSDALQYLIIMIDWNEHTVLQGATPYINMSNDWKGGVNPDIIMEAQDFLEKCYGLVITWDFTFSASGLNAGTPLRQKLECGESSSYTPPNLPRGNAMTYSPIGMKEVKLKKNS